MRQVHAVPRRHELADAASSRRSRTDAARRRTWTSSSRVAERINGKCLCPLGDSDAIAVIELLRQVPRRVPGAHRRGRLPVPRRVVARPRCSPRRDARPRPRHPGARMSELRQGHDRRPRGRGRRRAPGSSRRPRRQGSRSPSSATSPASGRRSAPAGCASSRSRGSRSSRPAARSRAQDGMVVQDRRLLGEGGRGPERDARVHPRQPSARLPGLRQGRRVPAAGPDVPLRAGQHADVVPEDHAREADPDLADDRARPRALHPLLPLHALLVGRRRGQPARRPQPRRAHRDRDLRERPLPRAVLGQRDRALPRRRADLDAVPLRGAAVGHPERPDRLRPLPRRLQRQRDGARGQGQAHPLAQPPRGRRRLALRQGPVHLPAPAAPTTGSPSRSSAAGSASSRSAGTPRSTRRGAAPRRRGRIVTALSGSETIEQAYALARLLRGGLGAHAAVLPESTSDALDAFRLPLSAIAEAEIVVIVGDDAVADRAPVVDLWLKAARAQRRRGRPLRADRLGPDRSPAAPPRALRALAEPGNELGERLRAAERGDPRLVGPRRRRRRTARRGRARARLRAASPAAAPSICRRRRTAAASRRPGPPRPTRTRRTRSRSGC